VLVKANFNLNRRRRIKEGKISSYINTKQNKKEDKKLKEKKQVTIVCI